MYGFSPEEERNTRSKYPVRIRGQSVLSARVIATGRAQHIEDIRADKGITTPPMRRVATVAARSACQCCARGKPLGVIVVAWREPGTTPEHQIDLLTTFAAQAVIAIENVRLFTELQRRAGAADRDRGNPTR